MVPTTFSLKEIIPFFNYPIFRPKGENNISYDADEGCYERYRENGNVESVYMYDRYEYDLAEPQTSHGQKQSFCKKMKSFCSDMGRLIRFNMDVGGNGHRMSRKIC